MALVSRAQETESEKTDPAVTLNVGNSTGRPGDVVDIPLVLSAPEIARVGSLVGEISFPKMVLSLMKAKQGLSAELSEAKVEARVRDDTGDTGLSILEFSILAKEPLRPGIAVYLVLKVSENAAKGKATLALRDLKATTEKGEPLQVAKGESGGVEILDKDEVPYQTYY